MAFTHTHSRNFSSGSATDTASKSYEASSEINIQETVAAGANTQINVAIDISELVSLYLKSDVDCTVYVNDVSGGSPTKTITLAANEPYCWPMGGNTNPLGASDVTEIYVTNAAEAEITMYALVDATP